MSSTEAPAPSRDSGRALAALAVTVAVWLALTAYLVPLGQHLPVAVQRLVSFSTFRMVCQIASTAAGVGLAFALVPGARDALGLSRPRGSSLALAALSWPLVWVLSTVVAIKIAEPVLLAELATRGPGASARNAGSFGRELAESSLFTMVLSGAVLAAIAEELLFRGALWSLVDRALARFKKADPPPPDDLAAMTESPARRVASALFSTSTVATVVAGLAFGYMHRDLPGGVGLVRLVSTTCLGLASGALRQSTGSIAVCIALHTLHNLTALAVARGLFTSRTTLLDVPLPTALVGLSAVAALALPFAARAARKRDP